MKKSKLLEPVLIEYSLDNPEDKDMYDEMLDQWGPIQVVGISFDPHYILENLDETAYNTGFNDLTDGLDDRWQCPLCEKIHRDEDSAKYCCQIEE